MSIQPLFRDPDFGYVVAIELGQHFHWGQEIVVEFADGRSIVLGPDSYGSALRDGCVKFLEAQSAPEQQK